MAENYCHSLQVELKVQRVEPCCLLLARRLHEDSDDSAVRLGGHYGTAEQEDSDGSNRHVWFSEHYGSVGQDSSPEAEADTYDIFNNPFDD